MIQEFALLLTIFMLAFTVGSELLSKVPPTLHLPFVAGLAVAGGSLIAATALLLQFGDDATRTGLGFLTTFLVAFQTVAALIFGRRLLAELRKKR